MKLDIDQKLVCTIDEKLVKNILDNIHEDDWKSSIDYRNKIFPDVTSIPIFHSPKCGVPEGTLADVKKGPLFEKYHPLVLPILDELKKYYDYNYHASFLARLKPHGKIHTHRDTGEFLERCHRIHVPLQTNELVGYWINQKRYFWDVGNIYEFDNTLTHAVTNQSYLYRIHLILNLYKVTDEELATLPQI